MFNINIPPLARMAHKLASHANISIDEHASLLSLPHILRSFEPGSYLVREGDVSDHCSVLVSGFAMRHKISREGLRQIVSIHIPGELLDLQRIHLGTADHNVQTLTLCQVAKIPHFAIQALALDRLNVGNALFASTLVEASIYREWMLNIGRRNARTRIAHLLCEFAIRLDRHDLAPGQAYELPMTREQIGDAVGLTAVHVSRTLKSLTDDGLINQNKRGLSFPDWSKLKEEAGFNARYLHLPETGNL